MTAPNAGKQLMDALNYLSPLKFGTLNYLESPAGDSAAFYPARLSLLSASLVTQFIDVTNTLGVHEINALFQLRESLHAMDEELQVILRTLLQDGADVKPGWFWFRDFAPTKIADWLLSLLATRSPQALKELIIEILDKTKIQISPSDRALLLGEILPTIDSALEAAAWSYIADTATLDEISALPEKVAGTWLASRMDWLSQWVKSERKLDRFLETPQDINLLPSSFRTAIHSTLGGLSDNAVNVLETSADKNLANSAKRELDRRRGLPMPTAGDLLSSLVGPLPEPPTGESDEQTYARFENFDSETLRKSIDWYDIKSPIAYRLLAARGEIPTETIREDMKTGFSRIHEDSKQHNRTLRSPEFAQIVDEQFNDVHDFLATQYNRVGLQLLAENPDPRDLDLARQYTQDYRVRLEAVRIMGAVGNENDLAALIEIAGSSGDDVRDAALKGILNLAVDKAKTAQSMVDNGSTALIQAAIVLLSDSNKELSSLLWQMIQSKNGRLRTIGISELHARLPTGVLVEILGDYVKLGTYYYDVVTWIDRIVYAPEPLRHYFIQKLQKEWLPTATGPTALVVNGSKF